MKKTLLAILLLGAGSAFAETHWSIGIGVGVPAGGYYYEAAPPPLPAEYVPPCPAPGYTWVQGYWYPNGGQYYWHAGYWSRPPYEGGYWVSPRHYEHRYHPGYWERGERHWERGERHWDRDHDHERWEHHERHGDHDGRHWDR